MYRHLLKSKIHQATITGAELHYEGSLTLDEELMIAADLITNEMIQVVNVNTGERFTTYVIPGPRGSGVVQLSGAAARLGHPGDLVILMAQAEYAPEEWATHAPRTVLVDQHNRIVNQIASVAGRA
jgi:aspartate 1-decarboxylase